MDANELLVSHEPTERAPIPLSLLDRVVDVPQQDSRILMHKFVDEMKALLERFSWSATIPRHELLRVLRDSGVKL